MYRYFKKIDNGDHISSWESKVLSHKSIKPPATSENSLVPSLSYFGSVYNKIKPHLLMEKQ